MWVAAGTLQEYLQKHMSGLNALSEHTAGHRPSENIQSAEHHLLALQVGNPNCCRQ
jgi:hypothetical protein